MALGVIWANGLWNEPIWNAAIWEQGAPAANPPVFFGPIPAQTWLPGVAITAINLADYFTPDGTTYAAVAGTLPTGTSLNTGSGVISGTPTQTGAFTGHQYSATNADGIDNTNVFSITVPALALQSSVINRDQFTLNWNMVARAGAGGQTGFVLTASGGAVTIGAFAPVPSLGWVATLSREIDITETVTLAYTQPGNGVEDLAGNDYATFAGQSVAVLNGGSDLLERLRRYSGYRERASISRFPRLPKHRV